MDASIRRSIPAWAGETPQPHISLGEHPVYPRVGGGNQSRYAIGQRREGLSPRGRGKLQIGGYDDGEDRSIPAWAGETAPYRGGAGCAEVYPRVGGGNVRTLPKRANTRGLSPRGRGKRRGLGCKHGRTRSIPAWAGETLSQEHLQAYATVYPRVGGGNARAFDAASSNAGLSPRGRGKLHISPHTRGELRSIPAWAGETVRAF